MTNASEKVTNPADLTQAEHAEILRQRREEVLQMGGPEKVAAQHAAGKMTVRERIDLLFDQGTFREFGRLAWHNSLSPEMEGKHTPADGVVTGWGEVNGRIVCVVAWDYTVIAGTMGEVAENKAARMREWALNQRVPIIYLVDSAGARVHEQRGAAIITGGATFFTQSNMSGVIPQLCAVMGPGAAGTAYLPALCDFVVMVRRTSNMALAGPPLVKAVLGEDISAEDLGGADMHNEVSGVADMAVDDDKAAIQALKDYLSYMPSHNKEKPARVEPNPRDPELDAKIETVVPVPVRRGWDMYDLINLIVDDGVRFDMKGNFAKNIITCFARIDGRVVGVVANQPKALGGAIDIDAADKAARFMQICDAYNIPLVFLVDTPAFFPGSKMERQGIIRHGAKMLHIVSTVTVPKLVVFVRKAYGGGIIVMAGGTSFNPDLLVSWPAAEIGVMGAEGAVNIIKRKKIMASDDPEKTRREEVAAFQKLTEPLVAARQALLDEVILPNETRTVLADHLKLTENKVDERPWRKRGIIPV